MIKVEKDLTKIPDSLQFPDRAFFSGHVPSPPRTTHKRRNELISHGGYIDKNEYNSRYKQKDTKDALKEIYKNKCAYCEQKVEQLHVEHYRPKSIYYWLTYSWDNLLLACGFCNSHKKEKFELFGNRVYLNLTTYDERKIHTLSIDYDRIEQPKLINPEKDDPREWINFGLDGSISGTNERMIETIEICKINRTYLKDERRKIIDNLRLNLEAEIIEADSQVDQEKAIGVIVRQFVRDAKDETRDFLAFRKYMAMHKLSEIVKALAS